MSCVRTHLTLLHFSHRWSDSPCYQLCGRPCMTDHLTPCLPVDPHSLCCLEQAVRYLGLLYHTHTRLGGGPPRPDAISHGRVIHLWLISVAFFDDPSVDAPISVSGPLLSFVSHHFAGDDIFGFLGSSAEPPPRPILPRVAAATSPAQREVSFQPVRPLPAIGSVVQRQVPVPPLTCQRRRLINPEESHKNPVHRHHVCCGNRASTDCAVPNLSPPPTKPGAVQFWTAKDRTTNATMNCWKTFYATRNSFWALLNCKTKAVHKGQNSFCIIICIIIYAFIYLFIFMNGHPLGTTLAPKDRPTANPGAKRGQKLKFPKRIFLTFWVDGQ